MFEELSVAILGFLVLLMLGLMLKYKEYYLILILYVFSIIIGMVALTDFDIPFSPFLQILFLLLQSIMFIITALDHYRINWRNK